MTDTQDAASVDGSGPSERVLQAREGRIPFRVRIGATGHRKLADRDAIAAAVRERLEHIRDDLLCPPSAATPVLFTILSALAEGGDRIVAQEAMALFESADTRLEAVLPLPVPDYLLDFKTEQSKLEFRDLLGSASTQVNLEDPELHRDEAYERAGRYIVDRCDILIAIWDGLLPRGRGGTAEIVEYARSQDVPVLVIPTSDRWSPQGVRDIELESRGISRQLAPVRDAVGRLDDYNRPPIHDRRFQEKIRAYDQRLGGSLEGSSVHWQYQLVANWALPHYARADVLAVRSESVYNLLTRAIHCLAAAAVTAVAAQVVWAPENPTWLAFEVGLLLTLVAVVLYGRHRRVHGRWIGYRSLAEAFRSAIFIVLAGIAPMRGQSDPAPLGETDEPWFQRAFSEAWTQRPGVSFDSVNADDLRCFLAEQWIGHQIRYHRSAEERHRRARERYLAAILSTFGLAFAVALLHVFRVEAWHWTAEVLVFLAISLPAWGAALAGLRERGQHPVHEERSQRTARRLQRVKDQVEKREGLDEVRQFAAETQDVMVEENLDWSGVIEFQDLELVV